MGLILQSSFGVQYSQNKQPFDLGMGVSSVSVCMLCVHVCVLFVSSSLYSVLVCTSVCGVYSLTCLLQITTAVLSVAAFVYVGLLVNGFMRRTGSFFCELKVQCCVVR